jgi:methyl-accepting chemotaxis protein
MSLNDWKLRTKSLVPLGMLCLTVLAMVAFGALRLNDQSKEAREIIEQRDVGVLDLARAGRAALFIPYDVFGAILFDNAAPQGVAAKQTFESTAKSVTELFESSAAKLPDHAAEISKFEQRTLALLETAKQVFKEGYDQPGLDHGRALKPQELDAMALATKHSGEVDDEARKIVADLQTFNNLLIDENVRAAQQLSAHSQSAMLTLAVVGVLSTLFAGVFALWLTSAKIVGPLKRLGEQMRTLASGDLSVEIEGGARRDEIGDMAKAVEVFKDNAVARRRAEAQAEQNRAAAEAEREASSKQRAAIREAQEAAINALRDGLARLADGNLSVRLDQGFAAEYAALRDDFNAAADKLRVALGLVVRSTGSIQSSTQEITSASDNLSQRTEQQAASLEETAAALEKITRTVRASASNAQHAASVVAAADSDANKGAVIVRQAVAAMDAIADSSNKIGQIIGVIDEIAFQTNLLALNAGVEAARAGDSGRGFAVVAMEVRALAQRSAEAAKEIKALVSTSGAQVHSGVKLVAESGKALESIISQVTEINKVVGEIAEATQQQATGLAQINSAISQMDQTTQQNATMVEESTAASHSLSKEMGELTRLVDQFRLAEPAQADHRRPGEDLRRNLKAAAPHAFAKPAAPPPRGKSTPAPRLARSSGTDWAEF